MIWDIHVHVAGVGTQDSGNFLATRFRRGMAARLVMKRLGLAPGVLTADDCDEQIARFTLKQLNASQVDRAVLLAFDAAYREDGTRDDARTLMVTSNDFVAKLAAANEKTLFGASVHPWRRDALAELERVIEKGACLIKWLPGAQNIQPDHPRCFPFYETMAKHGIPLLCHTGAEHILKAFPDTLNDPRRLLPALERGVTVIAAHCGTGLMLHERSHLPTWKELALRYERFYGDISAFGVITRIWTLERMLRSPRWASKCVFGSDFPVAPVPLSCISKLGIKRALEIRRISNLFDQFIELMRAAGVPNDLFDRAGRLLRIPKQQKAEPILAMTGVAL
jgi:predicted TIM-barrel fold metal-dependent hydrolase